ncbi:MAG: hypothetical protein ACXW1N_08970 [Halobacteriota archaeon]
MPESQSELVGHYQKTYELTYELWAQRNRTFLVLIAVIGAATLLTYRAPDTNSLLVDIVANTVGVSDNKERVDEMRRSFPFALLQSVLLLVVFYLMVNLFHRSLYVLRNYAYLGALEKEIRSSLGMTPNDVAFTRESSFYWVKRPHLLGYVKWIYVLLLGLLLFSFLIGRLVQDIGTGSQLLTLVDAIVAVPTALFFFGYAYYSISFDSATSILQGVR